MLRKVLALVVVAGLTAALAQQAVATDGRARSTCLSQSAPQDELWVQASAGSREVLRPPGRSPWQPSLRTSVLWIDTRDVDARAQRQRARQSVHRPVLPCRRALQRRSLCSSANGDPPA